MSLTADVTVLDTQFTVLSSGSVRCFVQLKEHGTIVCQVGSSLPANDSVEGVVLETGEAHEVSFDNLDAGDNVYARSLSGKPLNVATISSSQAPV